jgi:hypothetical protein
VCSCKHNDTCKQARRCVQARPVAERVVGDAILLLLLLCSFPVKRKQHHIAVTAIEARVTATVRTVNNRNSERVFQRATKHDDACQPFSFNFCVSVRDQPRRQGRFGLGFIFWFPELKHQTLTSIFCANSLSTYLFEGIIVYMYKSYFW